MEDAAGFFANVFGGERFAEYIGEITIMKDMTTVATMMTEEEKAEVETQLNGGQKPASSVDAPTTPSADNSESPSLPVSQSTPQSAPSSPPEAQIHPSSLVPHSKDSKDASTASLSSSTRENAREKEKEAAARKKRIAAEHREKWREQEKERRKAMEERVTSLTTKLIERLRPFVEAKNPGDKDDPETQAFEARFKREAEDLKLESFGVELLHTIGMVYMMKATSFLKSKKFLGIPGFFSRLKEKGSLAKDVWGVIGSALSVRDVMLEMEKMQAKGELGEEELRALEMDVTGKIMLASWRGARLEVIQVLREVLDHVLKEPGVPDSVMYNRARGLLLIGAVFKSTVPDESDAERRELERMVAEAAAPKPKHKTAKSKREELLKAKEFAEKQAKEKPSPSPSPTPAAAPAPEPSASA
ncbi:X-domain of DnaJ-containing-domain-containing protein [Armillaria fumosa]|nr:X-domain of DnaJ-containing-domain-containing protein [Armillaria fumosa]